MRECHYCKKVYHPSQGPVCPDCKYYTYNPIYDERNEERKYEDRNKKYHLGAIILIICLLATITYHFVIR